jgi:hypothetical protein
MKDRDKAIAAALDGLAHAADATDANGTQMARRRRKRTA